MSAVPESDCFIASLDAAPDDAARQALLARCPPALLEAVNATLCYRRFRHETDAASAAEAAAFAAFTQQLDAAADDAERLAVIEAARRDPQRGGAFVSEWTWRRAASAADWLRRYFELAGATDRGA
jgi:hypothetical protein